MGEVNQSILSSSFANQSRSSGSKLDESTSSSDKSSSLRPDRKMNKIKPSKHNSSKIPNITPTKVTQKLKQKNVQRKAKQIWTSVEACTQYGVSTVREKNLKNMFRN